SRRRSRVRPPAEEATGGSHGSAHRRRAAASAAPVSSPFEMKPRAEVATRRRRYEDAARVEMSTTAGGCGSIASRSATSKPSRSGSCTSSSTTSGPSCSAARIAEAPSPASPTTSKPSDVSRERANARNPSWSSTIRTDSLISRSVAQTDRRGIGAHPASSKKGLHPATNRPPQGLEPLDPPRYQGGQDGISSGCGPYSARSHYWTRTWVELQSERHISRRESRWLSRRSTTSVAVSISRARADCHFDLTGDPA